jgi:hypothetical protein
MDARVAFEPLLDAFGVPATVTRPAPDNDPIETVGIWLLPHNMDEPIASGFQRREPVRVFALSKDAVPTLPRNTRIEAPERAGGDIRVWVVDSADFDDPDHTRALLVRAREYES